MNSSSRSENLDFTDKIIAIDNKVGKEQLTDDQLLLLAARSILKSYTFEEKGYK